MKFVYGDYFFYKLVCLTDDIDLSYVGSTTNWRQRTYIHKSNCNNENSKEYNTKKYQIIRENGGFQNWKMVQIGYRENLTKREAEAVEEEYRVQLRAEMNGRKCGSGCETKQEYNKNYYQEHRQEAVDYQKEYYQDHKQEINEKINCEICGGRYTYANKIKHTKTNKHLKALSNTPTTSTDNTPLD